MSVFLSAEAAKGKLIEWDPRDGHRDPLIPPAIRDHHCPADTRLRCSACVRGCFCCCFWLVDGRGLTGQCNLAGLQRHWFSPRSDPDVTIWQGFLSWGTIKRSGKHGHILPCSPLRGRGLIYLLYPKNSKWRWLIAISTPRFEKCNNFLMTVRPVSWACGHVAEMLLVQKKNLFSTWLFKGKS